MKDLYHLSSDFAKIAPPSCSPYIQGPLLITALLIKTPPYFMSKKMDVSKLSITDLEALQENVERELEQRKEAERKKAIEQIQEIAKQAGFSLDELVGKQAPKPKPKVRYRDPEHPENTWAGRGRKPKWLEQALAEGRSLEEFAV